MFKGNRVYAAEVGNSLMEVGDGNQLNMWAATAEATASHQRKD